MTGPRTKGHTGGCKCGAIRYRTRLHTGNAYVCNCHFCQRMTGGPFLVEHCFSREDIEVLAGEHRRAPDGSINPGHVYEDHLRAGDGGGA